MCVREAKERVGIQLDGEETEGGEERGGERWSWGAYEAVAAENMVRYLICKMASLR